MLHALRKRISGKKGFTLIELIVVIAIVAILAVILIPRFSGFSRSAREKSALSDARNVLMALEAMDAEEKFPSASELEAKVDEYLGKDLDGRIYNASNTSGISFKYTVELGGKYYTVTCTEGILKENVEESTSTPTGYPTT